MTFRRYSIVSTGLHVSKIEEEVRRIGGRNIKAVPVLNQVMCDLEDEAVHKLTQVPGLAAKPVRGLTMDGMDARTQARTRVLGRTTIPGVTPPMPPQPVGALQFPVYGALQASIFSTFYKLRQMFNPPLTGAGSTICVLDTGIRKTHVGLRGKVIHEVDVSGSGSPNDVFGHGTSVAYMAAGGEHAEGVESGLAPGAKIVNIKVIDDDGEGTEEEAVLGLEVVGEMLQDAETKGLHRTDDMYPNAINMSFGSPDDGDENSPMRVACRALNENFGIGMAAAAGNTGPGAGTVTSPATDEAVAAVGAVTFSPWNVWYYSGRGPTKDGVVKPDFVFFGVDVLVASHENDEAYKVKSGTSFACPGGVGLVQLGWEGARRLYGENFWESWDAVKQWVSTWCIKPEGYPAEKDELVGFGMPYGDKIISQVSGGVGGLGGITEIIPAMMAMGMMAPIMKMASKK